MLQQEESNPMYQPGPFEADFSNPAYRETVALGFEGDGSVIETTVLGTESVDMDEIVPLSPKEVALMDPQGSEVPIGQSDTLY